MSGQALGLIETFGYIGAVEAADVCLKAANVKLIGVRLVTGGLVMVAVTGDVGAVNAAIAASKDAVGKVGKVVSSHVIPRPSPDTSRLLESTRAKTDSTNGKTDMNKNGDEVSQAEGEFDKDGFLTLEFIQKLNSMKVVELRTLARQSPGIKIERNHIKYANRKELLEAILDHHERKS